MRERVIKILLLVDELVFEAEVYCRLNRSCTGENNDNKENVRVFSTILLGNNIWRYQFPILHGGVVGGGGTSYVNLQHNNAYRCALLN